MTTLTDRFYGVTEGLALKVPCRVATTADITLSGLQTIDGVTVVAEDRVLVKDQTDATTNGIYVAVAGVWARAQDFNDNNETIKGTRVYVNEGTVGALIMYYVSTSDPIVIGTSNIVFAASGVPGALIPSQPEAIAGTNNTKSMTPLRTGDAIKGYEYVVNSTTARSTVERFGDYVSVKDYGAKGDGTTDDTAVLQAAIDSGLPLVWPTGVYRITTTLTATNAQTWITFGSPTIVYDAPSGSAVAPAIDFRAKAIVGGDFYINHQADTKAFIAPTVYNGDLVAGSAVLVQGDESQIAGITIANSWDNGIIAAKIDATTGAYTAGSPKHGSFTNIKTRLCGVGEHPAPLTGKGGFGINVGSASLWRVADCSDNSSYGGFAIDTGASGQAVISNCTAFSTKFDASNPTNGTGYSFYVGGSDSCLVNCVSYLSERSALWQDTGANIDVTNFMAYAPARDAVIIKSPSGNYKNLRIKNASNSSANTYDAIKIDSSAQAIYALTIDCQITGTSARYGVSTTGANAIEAHVSGVISATTGKLSLGGSNHKVGMSMPDAAPATGFKNRVVNPSGVFAQVALASSADGTYTFDQWLVLTQTGAVTPSALTDVADGLPNMMRVTQSQASAQRFGLIQPLTKNSIVDLRGKPVTLSAKVRMSAATTLRYAIVEWTGTADAPTKDVVNSWTDTTFAAGNFFIATTTTVAATGSISLSANTVTDILLSATISSSANNLHVFFWTDSAQAQNVTLDIGNVQLEHGYSATAFEVRPYLVEEALVRRFYRLNSVGLVGQFYNTTGASFGCPLDPPMHKAPSIGFVNGSTAAINNSGIGSGNATGIGSGVAFTATGGVINLTGYPATTSLSPAQLSSQSVYFNARM